MLTSFRVVAFGLAGFACLAGCANDGTNVHDDSPAHDTAARSPAAAPTRDTVATAANTAQTYSNERYRDVRVERLGGNTYRITGRAQLFEAAYSWAIEDGHDELQKGHGMTDAGAPEWGKFEFTVQAEKKRPNSALTLVLFESSAKDGGRQHELAVPLR